MGLGCKLQVICVTSWRIQITGINVKKILCLVNITEQRCGVNGWVETRSLKSESSGGGQKMRRVIFHAALSIC